MIEFAFASEREKGTVVSTLGTHTWHELCSQPQAWQEALDTLHAHNDLTQHPAIRQATHVIWCGCGSPFYLATSLQRMHHEHSTIPSYALPASEIWCNPQGSIPGHGRPTLVLLSRSGRTTEVLKAAERFREHAPNGHIITISCYGDRPLAQLGDINIVLPSGQEQSIAQTRAFTVLQMGGMWLLQHWAGRQFALDALPERAADLMQRHQQECLAYGANPDFQQFFFLGSGYRYGLACEASLKMKEMSLSTSEPFHHMEYRHGPQSMVTPQTLILGLGSLRMHSQEQAVLADMRALGGHTLSMGGHADHHMRWQLSDSDCYDGILALPLLQSIAFARSTSRGLDPDNPHNLNAVVVL